MSQIPPDHRKPRTRPGRLTLPLLLGYMGLVFGLSHMSRPPLPELLWSLSDKVLHAAEYVPLGYLCARVFRGPAKRRALLGLAVAALFGLTDEIHQWFIPGREASPWDWLADLLGSAVGAFLLYLTARRVSLGDRKRRQPA